MLWIFKALSDRLKAMFVADIATDFEAQLMARDAERKAELLRQAQKYEDEGLKSIAQEMRQQTECLGTQKPLASVLPAVEFFHTTQAELFPEDDAPVVGLLPAPDPSPAPATASIPPNINKKKRR
jgi:hypothetical protein